MDQSEADTLRALIEQNDGSTELQCGPYLKYAIDYLVPSTIISHSATFEQRGFFGDADLVISAEVNDDLNEKKQVAYIWELKAPQCFVMQEDSNKNRYIPTMHFLKAENQLIHYYREAKGSDIFRVAFRITATDNIKMGGIIIGRSGDRLAAKCDQPAVRTKALQSLGLRREILYQNHNIRVVHWDTILKFILSTKK